MENQNNLPEFTNEETLEYIDEIKELERLFDLRYKADMQAIERWHKAGNDELVWPDHADLVIWLLEQLEKAEKEKVHFRNKLRTEEMNYWYLQQRFEQEQLK